MEEYSKSEKQQEQKEHILKLARERGFTMPDKQIFKVVEDEIANIPAFAEKAIDYFLFKSNFRPDMDFMSIMIGLL
jgi:threonyl-tRNA synthetase